MLTTESISVPCQILDFGETHAVDVIVEPPLYPKRFIGGYRNRSTGVEHHHAAVQTIPRLQNYSRRQRNTRETQTICQRHVEQQTNNDTATQMTGIGVYVANVTDKLIEPRRYVTADECLNVRVKHVGLFTGVLLLALGARDLHTSD
jgi:IQ and ubiquitin-like domain-containing protein